VKAFAEVIKSHLSSYPNPLKVKKGGRVEVGNEDNDYAGWRWCTNTENTSGWVPVAYLDVGGSGAILRRDYDAAELSVDVGQRLEVTEIESGWAWGRDEVGSEGWVPLTCLKFEDA
jgi:uncharacterized protein YgiM (DUF1202 family)